MSMISHEDAVSWLGQRQGPADIFEFGFKRLLNDKGITELERSIKDGKSFRLPSSTVAPVFDMKDFLDGLINKDGLDWPVAVKAYSATLSKKANIEVAMTREHLEVAYTERQINGCALDEKIVRSPPFATTPG